MHSFSRLVMSSRVATRQDNAAFVLEDDDVMLTLEGSAASIAASAVPLLDGSRPLTEVATVLGTSPSVVSRVLRPVSEAALLLDVDESEALSGAEAFLAAYTSRCDFYRQEIFAQPFWREMRAGTCPPRVVLGWGVEMYHYVSAANEHMAAAVAHCRDRVDWRHWLAKHYVEEHDHDRGFLAGLVKCGLSESGVQKAPPLPGARALIDYLVELASSDSFAYSATFGVMQSPGEETTEDAINDLYAYFAAAYPAAHGVLEAFRAHALLDARLDHQDLVIARMCRRSFDDIPASSLRKALNAVRDVSEHFMLFFENVYTYYGDPASPLPRRPLDVRTLIGVR